MPLAEEGLALPFQPEGLPEGSRRLKQRGDLPVCGETSTHPNGVPESFRQSRVGNGHCGHATLTRENSGARFWRILWHPLGCMLFCQRFPEVSATLRPPATFWHRFAVRDGGAPSLP